MRGRERKYTWTCKFQVYDSSCMNTAELSQRFPVGLYNPIFDKFKALLSDPTTKTEYHAWSTPKTSSYCTAAVAMKRTDTEQWQTCSKISCMHLSWEFLHLIMRTLMEWLWRLHMACLSIVLFWNGKMTWERVIAMWLNRDAFLSEIIGSNPACAMQSFVHLLL